MHSLLAENPSHPLQLDLEVEELNHLVNLEDAPNEASAEATPERDEPVNLVASATTLDTSFLSWLLRQCHAEELPHPGGAPVGLGHEFDPDKAESRDSDGQNTPESLGQAEPIPQIVRPNDSSPTAPGPRSFSEGALAKGGWSSVALAEEETEVFGSSEADDLTLHAEEIRGLDSPPADPDLDARVDALMCQLRPKIASLDWNGLFRGNRRARRK